MKKALVLSLVLLLGVAITGMAKTNFFDNIYIEGDVTVEGTVTFADLDIVGDLDVNGATIVLDGSTYVHSLSAGYVSTQSGDIRLGLDADDYMKLVTSNGTADLDISHPGNTGALVTWLAGGWTLTGNFATDSTTVLLDGQTSVRGVSAGFVSLESSNSDIRLGYNATDYVTFAVTQTSSNLAITHTGTAAVTWAANTMTFTTGFEVIGSSIFDGVTIGTFDFSVDTTDFVVDVDGDITIAPTLDIVMTPTGGDIFVTGDTTQTGSFTITSHITTSGGNFIMGSTTLDETELGYLEGITPGTVAGNKAVIVDGSKDIATFGSITAATFNDGTATMNSGDLAGLTSIEMTGDLTMTGDCYITGDTTQTGSLTLLGAGGDLNVGDDADITGDLAVDGTANLDVTDVQGALTVGAFDFSVDATDFVVDVDGDISIVPQLDIVMTPTGGDILITGDITQTGSHTISVDLDVDGTTNLDVVDIDEQVDIADKVLIGGEYGATAIGLDATDPDQVFQAHGAISTDVTAAPYAAILCSLTNTSSLANDVSTFGSWSELYFTGDLTIEWANHAASWSNLELADAGGALTFDAKGAQPAYDATWLAGHTITFQSSDGLDLGANRLAAGLFIQSSITSGYTQDAAAEFAAILINANTLGGGYYEGFPIGLQFMHDSVDIDIEFQNEEQLANAADGVVTFTGDDATGIDLQVISSSHDTTGNASLTLDADAGENDDDTWILRSTANGNAFDIIQHATTEFSISSAGDATVTGDITVSGGDIIDGSGGGVAVTNKGTSIETLGGAQKTVITFTLTGAHDIDTGDGGKSAGVQVYDFPAGYIQILGALIDCSVETNSIYNADAADQYFISVGTVDGTQVADDDLTGTEADIIPKTTHDTDSSGANTQLVNDWHAQDVTVETFDGTGTAVDLFVNVAVPDANATGATTHAVTGTLTIFWINHGDY